MDRRLRRAPDAEWVLMYRLGLSRQRIAALVRAEPATVGYHLVIARRQDPELEAEHQAAAGAGMRVSYALDRVGSFHLGEEREHDNCRLRDGIFWIGGINPEGQPGSGPRHRVLPGRG
jgi:hypothetical protein